MFGRCAASPYETLHSDRVTSGAPSSEVVSRPTVSIEPARDVTARASDPHRLSGESTTSNGEDRIYGDFAPDTADHEVPRCVLRPTAAADPVASATTDQISPEFGPDSADSDVPDYPGPTSMGVCTLQRTGASSVEPWESASRPSNGGYSAAASSEVVNKPRRDTPTPSGVVDKPPQSVPDTSARSDVAHKLRSISWQAEDAPAEINPEAVPAAETTVARATHSVSAGVPYCDQVDLGDCGEPGMVGLSDSAPSLSRPESNAEDDLDPSFLKRSQSDVLP